MLERIKAYIDSFEELTILVDKDINIENIDFYLIENKRKNKLEIISFFEEYNFYKFVVKNIGVSLHKEYFIEDNKNNKCLLRSGSIIRTKEFDEKYKYDGPLGVEYTKEKTIFRLWTPVAKEIKLELIRKNERNQVPFIYKGKGLWECKVLGDLEGVGYLFYVRIFENFHVVHDPYALSSNANGEYNYVIDVNKLYKMKYQRPKFSGKYTDAIIYEASIRDFTYYLKQKETQGTFLGMVENHPTEISEPTGIEYIRSLGITHLQLLPIFDFGGVDDIKKNSQYNWGYNPEQYLVPCGWYSKNPNDPYSRINELLEFVDQCHKAGILVNMDVVFNHVYKHEEFPFDFLVPGYNYRVGLDGIMSNASFCGNDFASERYMCSRFICDALEHYAKIFHMSGFRFDLMGLLDVRTLKNAANRLEKINSTIMLYGEGWNMNNPLPEEERAHMFNHAKIPQYAFFNDCFRDFIRGSQYMGNKGYAYGESKKLFDLYHVVLGSCLDYYRFDNPTQSVNYVECHDNYTIYDYGKTFLGLETKNAIEAAKLALEIVLVSQGIPFIHAGEEFFRTKQGVENSYKTKDSINKIDYARRDKYIDFVNTIRDLISIRKQYDVFRMSTTKEIQNRVRPLIGLMDFHTYATILEGNDYFILVLIKNDRSIRKIENNNLQMIFDGSHKCEKSIEEFCIDKPGVYLFKGDRSKWS